VVDFIGNLQKWKGQLEKLKGEVDWALELLEEGLNSLGWKGLII
jgi:hypothetical protein